jgi:hypothetical protein
MVSQLRFEHHRFHRLRKSSKGRILSIVQYCPPLWIRTNALRPPSPTRLGERLLERQVIVL